MNEINLGTVNPNTHYLTNTSSFYYSEKMKNWYNLPMCYAMDIAIENYFSNLLEFSLDRIIYASNEYCFRERTRLNEGELNLPFLNYYRKGYGESERPWFNDYSNRFGLIDRANKFTSLLGGKMKIYPISFNYEATALFAQNKDCEYAMNKILYENSNETILFYELETNKGDIIKNIAIFNSDPEYMPTYQESDWLEQNRIWTIGIDFVVTTFMIGDFDDNPDLLHVAKKALLQFFSAKKFNYEHPLESKEMDLLLSEYFGK